MSRYHVDLASPPKGVVVPPLLADLGAFVAKQEHGALGYFDALRAAKIPKAMDQREGFSFLELPDGSLLALVPSGVLLLDSEGDKREIAGSLEEFLHLWAKGESGVDELDDGEPGALKKWLTSKKVKVPTSKAANTKASKAKAGAAPSGAKPAGRAPTAAMKRLGPKLQALASVIGLRADAPEVIAYVSKTLGKKAPATTTRDDAHVVAPKLGIELRFSHVVRHDAYPPIAKGRSFVPYLEHAAFDAKLGELVLGVPWDADAAAVKKILGAPTGHRTSFDDVELPFWRKVLDDGTGVVLEVTFDDRLTAEIFVPTARDLDEHAKMPTAVFVAWAATRGLLDEKRFPAGALAALAAKSQRGSEFLKTAAPRGLWDDHLKGSEELHLFAYNYFHRVGGVGWLKADLEELRIKDDDWPSVAKASKRLAERFAPFLQA